MDRQLIIICLLTMAINLIGTLAYAARIAGVRTRRIAMSFALFNILVLVSRTSNSFLGPNPRQADREPHFRRRGRCAAGGFPAGAGLRLAGRAYPHPAGADRTAPVRHARSAISRNTAQPCAWCCTAPRPRPALTHACAMR
jgi:hypothetical protein